MKTYDPNELYLIVPEIANIFKLIYDGKFHPNKKKYLPFQYGFLFTLDSLRDLEKVINIIKPDLPDGVRFHVDDTNDPIFTVYDKNKTPINYAVYLTTMVSK